MAKYTILFGDYLQHNDNGIEIDDNLLEQIIVGESKYVNNSIVNN